MLYNIIYISKAVNLLTDADLEQILLVSRKNNEDRHITGVLLYLEGYFLTMKEGRFIQVLEGDEEDVKAIYEDRIKLDRRHQSLIVLQSAPLKKRNFEDWSMGFQALDEDDFKEQPNYFNVNEYFSHNQQSNIPINYLKSFYRMHDPKV